MPGPPPKPTRLRLLQGNPGQRRIEPEPMPAEGPLYPPEHWAADDPTALEEWERLLPILEAMHLVTLVDRAALIIYCEAWSTYREAIGYVRDEGVTVTGKLGNPVRNPALQTARDATSVLHRFGTEFGLTPAARARMSAPVVEDQDSRIAAIMTG